MNDFNIMADKYRQTNIKPDKLFSILPTVVRMVSDVRGKRVLDIGCGSGFFTEAIAKLGAEKVYGLDRSSRQLTLAREAQPINCEYIFGDMFMDKLPTVDLILTPFVLNYAESVKQLEMLLHRFSAALNKNGHLISVIDLPSGADLSRFGARKRLPHGVFDGAPMEIALFENDQLIATLQATYFRPETIEQICQKAGFAEFSWEQPIIAPEGIRQYGADFWSNYLDSPELGYFIGRKR